MLLAKGSICLFTDADNATPIEHIDGFISKINEGFDVVIGSRAVKDAIIVEAQSLVRETIGRLGNFYIRLLAVPGIYDTQCGFKCFKRKVAKDLFSRQKINNWAFDVEILYLAQNLNYRIKEMPVSWTHHDFSKIVPIDYIAMLYDVIRIRIMHRKVVVQN